MDKAPSIEELEAELARARGIAQRYAEAVRQHFGTRLGRVVLFGSAARGDWGPESDIDVLVLLDRVDTGDEHWLVQRALEDGVLDDGTVLQPIYMTEQGFNELRDRERLFAQEVEREGVAL